MTAPCPHTRRHKDRPCPECAGPWHPPSRQPDDLDDMPERPSIYADPGRTDATNTSAEKPSESAEMNRADFKEIIDEWLGYWMNQTQNSKADYDNYFRRAFGVDANMRHHLAGLLEKATHEWRKKNGG